MAWVDVASEKPQIGVLTPSMIAVVPEPLGGISHDNRGRVGGAGALTEGWRELLVGAHAHTHRSGASAGITSISIFFFVLHSPRNWENYLLFIWYLAYSILSEKPEVIRTIYYNIDNP